MVNYIRSYFLRFFIIYAFAGFIITIANGQNSSRKLLNENWQFTYQDILFPARVPGCIHADLFRYKQIPDPFIANNDSVLQWIGQQDWTYINNFDIPDSIWNKQFIEISFKGLDTYASVYLNDSLVIRADNMFRTWTISCKNILHNKNNYLKVVFESAENKSKKLFEQYRYKLPGDERVMTRKAQYQYGWDFGPKFLTCGIWKNVEITGWDYFSVTSINLTTDTINDKMAWVTANLKITTSANSQITFDIGNKNSGKLLTKFTSALNKGENEATIRFMIKDPIRWWCNGYGEPYLYDLIFYFTDNNKHHELIEMNYGLKTIELTEEPDSAGKNFYFKLNGIPVFMKGANYVPMDFFPSEIRNSQYDSLLTDAVNCHFNMVRVWGGGIYENEEFYNLCDKKGIMIWQDFMFACGMYPFDPLFLENVKAEAEEQVIRLSNHACISLYCGNNENSEGWHRWGWQDAFNEKEKKEIWAGYQKIFDEILPGIVNKYATIPYWESSPSLGRGDPLHTTRGDAHNWFVWHDGEPFENYEQKVPRFMSEFGCQSYPPAETIKTIGGNDSLFGASVQSHQKTKNGNDIIKKYITNYYGPVKNNDDFIYLSQLTQAEGTTKGIEAHRRNKPYCMGSLYWQFNDCWPAISWSSRDYDGRWKALQYFSKKAFGTFLISISEEKDSMLFYIISDSVQNISCTMQIRIYDFNGKKGRKKEITFVLNSNAVQVKKVSKKSLGLSVKNNADKIVYSVLQTGNKIVADHIYYFAKPFELPLEKAEIKIKKTNTANGIELELSCNKPVKNLYLSNTAGGSFSDNFFDMMPGKNYPVLLKNISVGIVPEIKIKSIFETR